jgi:hypothetical protein
MEFKAGENPAVQEMDYLLTLCPKNQSTIIEQLISKRMPLDPATCFRN